MKRIYKLAIIWTISALIIFAGIYAVVYKNAEQRVLGAGTAKITINLIGDLFPNQTAFTINPEDIEGSVKDIPAQISTAMFFPRSDLSASISFDVTCGKDAEFWQISYDKVLAISGFDGQLNTLTVISDNPNIDTNFQDCLLTAQAYRTAYYALLKLDNSYQPSQLLTFVENSWQIDPQGGMYELLDKLKANSDEGLIEPIYKVKDGQILLLANYREGRSLNIDNSINSIALWLKEPTADVPVAYDLTKPEMLNLPYPVMDFTQYLGSGETRMLLNNEQGVYNDINDFIIYGLTDLQDLIVQPGQSISYIDLVNPSRSRQLKNGNYVGDGICMATTTLFRAALNSGLEIVDRSSHGKNYPSYAWGDERYQYNIVDAAYYTSPEVNFEFRNNTNYPILISVSVERKDGYQYHKVAILGNSQSELRTVEFANWQVNMNGNTIRSGSFDRLVKVNDEVIEQRTFTSQYY